MSARMLSRRGTDCPFRVPAEVRDPSRTCVPKPARTERPRKRFISIDVSAENAHRTGDRLGRHPAPKCLTEARRETFGINRSGAGYAPASEADGEVLLDRRSGNLQPVECASEFGGLTVVEFPPNCADLISHG